MPGLARTPVRRETGPPARLTVGSLGHVVDCYLLKRETQILEQGGRIVVARVNLVRDEARALERELQVLDGCPLLARLAHGQYRFGDGLVAGQSAHQRR